MLVEAGDEGAEVDAGGVAEGISDELVCGLGEFDGVDFGLVELLAQGGDVVADVNAGEEVVGLESLEAGNLANEVHDTVVAAHEFLEAGAGAAEVLLPVGVGEFWSAAEHGGAENVDPASEGHVEGSGHVALGNHVGED